MSIRKDTNNMLIINNRKKINSELKFIIRKFFYLKEYKNVYFYGNGYNIFGKNQKFNSKKINSLDPSNWMSNNINDLKKKKILIINKTLNEKDLSFIKCFLETDYIVIDLIVICNNNEDVDFISSDFYNWNSIRVIKNNNIKFDDDYDMYLHHLYDN
jgi:hypothetical protein